MKTFVHQLASPDGKILAICATEKEWRAHRKWWREHGGYKPGEIIRTKIEFTMNRAGVARLLNERLTA